MGRLLGYLAVLLSTILLAFPHRADAGEQRDIVLTLDGGAQLPVTVILPDGYSEDALHPMVVALPGGRGDAALARAFLANYWIEEADRRGFILLAPAVFGPGLETEGFTVVEAIFDWADANLSYDPARVTLAGQSNGGLGAFYAARMAPDRFGALVVMPGGYGREGDLDQLAGKPVLLLVGEQDSNWVQLAQRTRDFLVLAGAEPRLQVVPGGHVFPYSSAALYDWIEQQYPDSR